jgi:hypothetical protein
LFPGIRTGVGHQQINPAKLGGGLGYEVLDVTVLAYVREDTTGRHGTALTDQPQRNRPVDPLFFWLGVSSAQPRCPPLRSLRLRHRRVRLLGPTRRRGRPWRWSGRLARGPGHCRKRRSCPSEVPSARREPAQSGQRALRFPEVIPSFPRSLRRA